MKTRPMVLIVWRDPSVGSDDGRLMKTRSIGWKLKAHKDGNVRLAQTRNSTGWHEILCIHPALIESTTYLNEGADE